MPQFHRPRWWLVAGMLFAGGIGVAWWAYHRVAAPRVNLLLITLDTTRADRLGAWGGPDQLTPALDELAAQSVVFERAYAPVPLTLPSHASLMTGLYPPEHGLRVNSGLHRLADTTPVLSERLRQRGYRTGAFIGSFVLDRKFGLDRGFDVYDDRMEEAHGPTAGDPHGHKMRIGERVVDAALSWLRHRPSAPFFCWVHLFDPHSPYDSRAALFGERFQDHPYDAGIAYVDQQVARLLADLRRRNLADRTVVIVVGDHGESLGEHQERSHGFTLYDATLHVPLLIRWNGDDAPVRRISTPVSLVDLYPTMLATLDSAAKVDCSGRNLLPACRGSELTPRGLYAESNHPLEETGAAPLRALIFDRWKYIRSPRPELYDLHADAAETQNLAENHAAELANLERQLRELESAFVLRETTAVVSSPHELRKLASLGYAGGGASPRVEEAERPDIKDVLPHYNVYADAQQLLGEAKYLDAETQLTQVVAAVPNFFQAWYNLGYCRERLQDLSGAEAAYQRAVEIDGNATALTALGGILLALKQPEQATTPLESAVALQPDLVRALFLLGEAYRQQQRWDDARKTYLDALALEPDLPPVRQALESLPRE